MVLFRVACLSRTTQHDDARRVVARVVIRVACVGWEDEGSAQSTLGGVQSSPPDRRLYGRLVPVPYISTTHALACKSTIDIGPVSNLILSSFHVSCTTVLSFNITSERQMTG